MLQVDIYTNNFAVSNMSQAARTQVEAFARRYVQYGFIKQYGRFVRAAIKVFASRTKDHQQYRFHINQLPAFREHLKYHHFDESRLQVIVHQPPEAADVELPVFESWVLRDYQEPVVDYMIAPEGPSARLICLQTGRGKSLISLMSASKLGKRIVIIVRPMFMEKWQEDVLKTYDIDIEDIVVVRGGSNLKALLEMGSNDTLDCKVILISNRTIQDWIKLYEEFGASIRNLGYACLPHEFFGNIKAGTLIKDEVHLDFHFNFKLDTYTHIQHYLACSATMLNEDDFICRMHEVAYPTPERYAAGEYIKYVDARVVIYRLKNPSRVRYKDYGRQTYSHNVFEESIMRVPQLLNNYMNLIDYCIKNTYMKEKRLKKRLLVYGASIKFCTVLTKFLKGKYPNLDVRRYVEEDPYENIMTADITVSTTLSAGTAVDIPDLTTVILTTAVKSSQSNIQGFGRLRELKDGTTPQFLYFCCEDIGKHIEYHEQKKELLSTRALSYRVEHIGQPI